MARSRTSDDHVPGAPHDPHPAKIHHAPCAFNARGVSEKTCIDTSSVMVRNRTGCCRTKCTSSARACLSCIAHGSGYVPATSAETGLCAWHSEHGRDVRKPPKAREGDDSVSLARASAPVRTAALAVPPAKRVAALPVARVELPQQIAPAKPAIQAPQRAAPAPSQTALVPKAVVPPKPAVVALVPVQTSRSLVVAAPAVASHTSGKWQDVLDRVKYAMGHAEYEVIDPRRIRPMPNQPRDYFDPSELGELADSMATCGQFMPGIVRAVELDGDVDRELLDGERRWRSALKKELGQYKAMRVVIDDEAAPFVIASIANFNRAGHTPTELFNAIVRLHEGSLVIPIEAIAKMYNMSVNWAYKLYSLRKVHPGIRALLDPKLPPKKRLPVTGVFGISVVPFERQAELVVSYQRGEISAHGMQAEAIKIAKAMGTYQGHPEEHQPARRIKTVSRKCTTAVSALEELKSFIRDPEVMSALKANPKTANGLRVTMVRAQDIARECAELLAGK